MSETTRYRILNSAAGLLLGFLMFASPSAFSQQAGVDLLGSPIPGITAIGHHAIGVNPSLLATKRPFDVKDRKVDMPDSLNRRGLRDFRRSQRLRFFSGFEGGLVAETPLLDGTSLVQWAEGD